VVRACGVARRNRYAAGSLPAARGPLRRRRGETPLEKVMRRRMAGSTAQRSRSLRSALIREAPDARAGAEAESWHARGGRSASLIQMQRARPRRPVPLLIGATDSTPWSRPVAPDAFPVVILGRARQRRVEGRGSSARLVEDTPLALPPGSTNEIRQCQIKLSRSRRRPSTTKGQQVGLRL
jgi:hypothetical protein